MNHLKRIFENENKHNSKIKTKNNNNETFKEIQRIITTRYT